MIHRILAWSTALLFAVAPAWGQSAQVPAPPQEQPILLHNTMVHPVADEGPTVFRGCVLFDGGLITRTGEGEPPTENLPANTLQINAEGMHLVPGFIAMATQVGMVETLQVDATDDRSEAGDQTPEVEPWIAVNPDSDLIPVARSAGILHALLTPTSGTISGRASLVRLDGWTIEDLVVVRDAGLVVQWPLAAPFRAPWMRRGADEQRSRIAKQLAAIDTYFDDAEAWQAAMAADPTTPGDLRFAALQPVLAGERPVMIQANSRGQIESALAWTNGRGLKPIIVGGAAAAQCIPSLKAANAAVVIDGVHRLPMARHDAWDTPFRLAAELHEAGIPFAIAAGDEPAHIRSLPHQAATAAAHGLPRSEALRAITRSPAEILGVDGRLGSIEKGRSATFFLCEGDPLEMSSPPVAAWIDGRGIDLGDRQKRFFEKYQEKYRQRKLID